ADGVSLRSILAGRPPGRSPKEARPGRGAWAPGPIRALVWKSRPSGAIFGPSLGQEARKLKGTQDRNGIPSTMNPHRLLPIAALMLAGCALAPDSATKAPPRTTVVFDHPEKYTDVKD